VTCLSRLGLVERFKVSLDQKGYPLSGRLVIQDSSWAKCLVAERCDANLSRQAEERYGSRSSWQRLNNAASSSRTPGVQRDDERARPR
jgi:hypothetical protein